MFLEVCAADEVALVDTVNGADLYASTATGAKRIINSCEIVFDLYCSVRTSFLALHTSYASV